MTTPAFAITDPLLSSTTPTILPDEICAWALLRANSASPSSSTTFDIESSLLFQLQDGRVPFGNFQANRAAVYLYRQARPHVASRKPVCVFHLKRYCFRLTRGIDHPKISATRSIVQPRGYLGITDNHMLLLGKKVSESRTSLRIGSLKIRGAGESADQNGFALPEPIFNGGHRTIRVLPDGPTRGRPVDLFEITTAQHVITDPKSQALKQIGREIHVLRDGAEHFLQSEVRLRFTGVSAVSKIRGKPFAD